jgi:eukaryotic-like serine/threonine-protein kinase
MLRYFKSREFLITLGVILGVTILSYLVFFYLFLPYYTNHGEETEVPDVSKMQLEEAIVAIEEAGLEYKIADSIYLVTAKPLEVVSQDPVARFKVKPGRPVYLTVNKVVAPMVSFPDITGVSQYQAKLRIEGAGLVFGQLSYVPHEYRNLVLGAAFKGKKLKEGDELRKGSKIDLVVGEGKGNLRVEIPSLVDKPYEVAVSTLQRLGLNIAQIRWDATSKKPFGAVIQQHPSYAEGDSVHLGAEFDLWLAGEEPNETPEGGGDTIVDRND